MIETTCDRCLHTRPCEETTLSLNEQRLKLWLCDRCAKELNTDFQKLFGRFCLAESVKVPGVWA